MDIKRVLVVLPHPDDEVFPMSGTLARLIDAGARVTYVCLTLGELGRNLGNPPFANRVTLPAVRRQELEASCQVLGIEDLRLWGYHDKTIEFEPWGPLDERIQAVIREVRPDQVYTFYPGYGVHPDHNACGAAVVRAVQGLPESERPMVLCAAGFQESPGRPPDIVNDIRPVLRRKLGALHAHSSQFALLGYTEKRPEEDPAFMERVVTERFWIYRFGQ